jgi:hypothetical protein
LIAGPPFVRALAELVVAAKLGPDEALQLSPDDCCRRLLAGHCAMTLAWPHRVSPGARANTTATQVVVGTAELPGSDDVYSMGDGQWHRRESSEAGRVPLLGTSGRLASVARTARARRAALAMLVHITSQQWSTDISPHSAATTLYRTSQIPDASAWTDGVLDSRNAALYAELVQQTQRRSLSLASIRLPGRHRYLSALDAAVHLAIQGAASPSDSLQNAADQWRSITAELGMETQQSAYWRSLGKEP